MFLGIERWLVGVAIALAVLAGSNAFSYFKGYRAGFAASEAKWADLKIEWERASAARERGLRQRGDQLAAELEVARTKVRVETIEVVRTIYKKASATRQCFSPDITEVLNRNAPIRETIERPDAPKQVIDHRSEAPAGGTSELAAAEWVANARAAHEECRAQIGKLGDWIRSLNARSGA